MPCTTNIRENQIIHTIDNTTWKIIRIYVCMDLFVYLSLYQSFVQTSEQRYNKHVTYRIHNNTFLKVVSQRPSTPPPIYHHRVRTPESSKIKINEISGKTPNSYSPCSKIHRKDAAHSVSTQGLYSAYIYFYFTFGTVPQNYIAPA